MSDPGPITPDFDLERVRSEIPALEDHIPLANCSQGPLGARTRAAIDRFVDSWAHSGMDWEGWIAEVEAARAGFARLIRADAQDVAVFSSVSHAASAVATAVAPEGDRRSFVLADAQFPGVGHAWSAQRARGAEIVSVGSGPDPVRAIEAEVDGRTRLVSVAHGDFRDGTRLDLAPVVEMAHDHGALVFVDAYQTLGTTPLDVRALEVDFLAGGALKYLMGTAGIAFLYIRPELSERLHPLVTGWFGRRRPFAFDPWTLDWAEGARRFDGGTPPILPAAAARAGIDWVLEIGVERIAPWIRTMSERLMAGGRDRGLELMGPEDVGRRTPVVAFRSPVESSAVERWMRERGVLVSARGSAIRVAPHFFTAPDDVDSALELLAEAFDALGPAAPR